MNKSIAFAMLLTMTGANWLPPARSAEPVDGYAVEVSRDKPTAWWRFNSPRAPFTSQGTEERWETAQDTPAAAPEST